MHKPLDLSALVPGSAVQVHSFGCWYDGTVELVTRGNHRAAVKYTTSGGTRVKTFSAGQVAAAGSYPAGQRIEVMGWGSRVNCFGADVEVVRAGAVLR